jgi:hypothetical protein
MGSSTGGITPETKRAFQVASETFLLLVNPPGGMVKERSVL